MGTEIRRAAVLGAGVMGSGIAAHLANAGIPVLLLDIVPPKLTEDDEKKGLTAEDPRFRNKFSMAGLEGIKKSKPAALYSKRYLPLIEIGNFEDDWERLAECDWIVEVVVERLDIKQKVFARVDEVRKPGSIVSSNTSGLSIAGMTEGRSEDFKQHFLVTHFFNPVRYMRLLELVAGEKTKPEILEFFTDFGRFRLGKGIVFGKDTPNFIGNRIGTYRHRRHHQGDDRDGLPGGRGGRHHRSGHGPPELGVVRHCGPRRHRRPRPRHQHHLRGLRGRRAARHLPGAGIHQEDDRGRLSRPQDQGQGRLLPHSQGSGRQQDQARHRLEDRRVPAQGAARHPVAQEGQDDPRRQAASARRGLRRRPRRRLRLAAPARHPRLQLGPIRRDFRLHRRHRQRPALGLQLGPRTVRDLGRARRRQGRRKDGGRRRQAGTLGHRDAGGRPRDVLHRVGRGPAVLRPGHHDLPRGTEARFLPRAGGHQAQREEDRLRQQERFTGRHRRRHRLHRVPLGAAAPHEPDRRPDHRRHGQGPRDRARGTSAAW